MPSHAACTQTLACSPQYSGKVGGRNDDLCITLQLAITGIRTFYQQSRYDQFRPETNRNAGVSMTA